MTVKQTHTPAHAGDRLEVHGPAGKPSRRSQVAEVLGGPGHKRYRVRLGREARIDLLSPSQRGDPAARRVAQPTKPANLRSFRRN
jgi:hypothetical protein